MADKLPQRKIADDENESTALLGPSNNSGVDEFPYKKNRLKPIDYASIIQKGEPWTDPTFPPGPQILFANSRHHASHDKWNYNEEDQQFYWRRASDHFKDKGKTLVIQDGIDPTDIIQGKLANCYFLAAVAGLAEDDPDLAR